MKKLVIALCLFSTIVFLSNYSAADASVAYAHYNQGNYQQAHAGFLELAQRGYPVYQNIVADMYINGLGVDKDQGLAYVWYSLSAAQGNRKAIALKERVRCKLSEAERARLMLLTEQYAAQYLEPYITTWSLAEYE